VWKISRRPWQRTDINLVQTKIEIISHVFPTSTTSILVPSSCTGPFAVSRGAIVSQRSRQAQTVASFLPRIMSSVVKSAAFLNVPRPKSRLYESVSPSTRSNSGVHPSSLVAFSIDAKKCWKNTQRQRHKPTHLSVVTVSWSDRHSDREGSLYLVPEREGLLLAEVEVLGVVVHELRLREPSSLHTSNSSHC
jgi:hypothetical protein